MEQAVKFIELSTKLCKALESANKAKTERIEGRRFDRIKVGDKVTLFVDRNSWELFGAKSSFQYNPRRLYGTLNTIDQYNWQTLTPIAGSDADKAHSARETEITKNYKPRGRPRKNPVKVTK